LRTPTVARKTTRLENILEDANVKAVLVLATSSSHLDIAQRAARVGKHV
jgi:UDP-N-acetyl-2-amino-2-deoxyglucuronate dehydrogenase